VIFSKGVASLIVLAALALGTDEAKEVKEVRND